MGGKAFTSAPYHLRTPRLPPQVYERLKTHLHNLLSTLYRHVATPVPAPEKKGHGDIDVLVAEPFNAHDPPDTLTVQKLLGAEYKLGAIGNPTKSFALRLSAADAEEVVAFQLQEGKFSANDPTTKPPLLAPIKGPRIHASEHDAETESCALAEDTLPSAAPLLYAQIDFRVCDSPDLFRWQVFHHGHGDLWNLLGTTIRPFGLTANERGLHVRIPEIERLNRTRALVWLTASPAAAMRFLGYEREVDDAAADGTVTSPGGGYPRQTKVLDTEFDSWEDLYRFVARGRFFRREKFVRLGDDATLFKANDRQRMKQRPGYRHFVLDWIPQLGEQDSQQPQQQQPQRTRENEQKAEPNGIHQQQHQESTAVAQVRTDMAMELEDDAEADADADDNDNITKTNDWHLRLQTLNEALLVFDQRAAYEETLLRWRRDRQELADKQATKAQRKAAFAFMEEYGRAWTEWLESNAANDATATSTGS